MDKKDIAKRKLDLLMRSIERVGKIGETLEELKAAAFEVLLLNHGSERSRWDVDHVVFATKVFTTKQSSDYAFLPKFKISLSKATKTTRVYIDTKTKTKRHQRQINDEIRYVFYAVNKNQNRYARKRRRKAA